GKKRSGVVMDLKRDEVAAKAEKGFAGLDKVLPKKGKEFVLLADFSEAGSMDLGVKTVIEKSMDLFNATSVKEILRVLPDPGMDIAFRIMSNAHYSKRPKVITYRSRKE